MNCSDAALTREEIGLWSVHHVWKNQKQIIYFINMVEPGRQKKVKNVW